MVCRAEQCCAMAFAQLTYPESLRDIELRLVACLLVLASGWRFFVTGAKSHLDAHRVDSAPTDRTAIQSNRRICSTAKFLARPQSSSGGVFDDGQRVLAEAKGTVFRVPRSCGSDCAKRRSKIFVAAMPIANWSSNAKGESLPNALKDKILLKQPMARRYRVSCAQKVLEGGVEVRSCYVLNFRHAESARGLPALEPRAPVHAFQS